MSSLSLPFPVMKDDVFVPVEEHYVVPITVFLLMICGLKVGNSDIN